MYRQKLVDVPAPRREEVPAEVQPRGGVEVQPTDVARVVGWYHTVPVRHGMRHVPSPMRVPSTPVMVRPLGVHVYDAMVRIRLAVLMETI
mmetsp:Transcript_19791/g.47813  ORF Transcript_19791/g.47813 Transcript_19791/m.47813 type:complete len:90 (-) Transcript_19791:230-499(-)